MNNYSLKKISLSDCDFSNSCFKGIPKEFDQLPSTPLSECSWSPNPAPVCYLQGAYDTDQGILFRITSERLPERAVNQTMNSNIYEDSCLEFFFSLDQKRYINIEVNANGAFLSAIGSSRYDRQFLSDLHYPLPKVEAIIRKYNWYVTCMFPCALLYESFQTTLDSANSLTANFYACGDLCPAPYFASWNPVLTETPDFHQLQFFGTINLAK